MTTLSADLKAARGLTGPQFQLLTEACAEGGTYTTDSYRPSQRLVALGLARWQRHNLSDRLVATDAGRRAIQAAEAKEKGGVDG